MHVELGRDEIESLVEALDCLKTKIAFTKGLTAAEKKERIIKVDELERKLLSGGSAE